MDACPFNVLSLCSGVGGLDLGIRLAIPSARVVCWVEREVAAVEILVRRMSEGRLDNAPVWSDVATFDGEPWRGVVDCVAAGFPCQDISNAGKGEGIKEGNRSGLFFHVVRVVRQVRPRYVFLENVAAILVRGLDTVLGSLAEAGYDAEWLCLKASEVGAPHRRDRFFLLAHDQGDGGRLLGGSNDGAAGTGTGEVRGRRVRKQQRATVDEQPEPRGSDVDRLDAGECDVADPGRERIPGRDGMHAGGVGGTPEEAEGQRQDAQRQRLRDTPVDGGEPLVNAARPEASRQRQQRKPVPRPENIPYWPPGPGERERWARILAARPDLAPAVESAVRGVADGTPAGVDLSRIDRLRGLGNLVVPLQAAIAFTLLWRRVNRED